MLQICEGFMTVNRHVGDAAAQHRPVRDVDSQHDPERGLPIDLEMLSLQCEKQLSAASVLFRVTASRDRAGNQLPP